MAILKNKKKKKGKKFIHYRVDKLREAGERNKCPWMLAMGEKGNGKTTNILMELFKRYFEFGFEIAYVRRWKDNVEGSAAKSYFTGLEFLEDEETGEIYNFIEKVSKGKWNSTYFFSDKWYFCYKGDSPEDFKKAEEPFAYAFGLSREDMYSSRAYPNVRSVFYDEFFTTGTYLKNEFALFTKLCNTILRNHDYDDGVRIYMAANTVDFASQNFLELGIDALDLKQGEITLIEYKEGANFLIEYCDTSLKQGGRKIDKMYGFGNVMTNMILYGKWATNDYPHCFEKFYKKDILYIYFIQFLNRTLQCEVVRGENGYFTYIHKKTTPIQDEKKDLIFTMEDSTNINYRKNLLVPFDEGGRDILQFYKMNKVFYQDNETGEIVKRYIDYCKQM